jgi:(2Fe-2S) ferredoxin
VAIAHYLAYIFIKNMTENNIKTVLICGGLTCKKHGSNNIITAFQKQSIPGVEIIKSGCLGQCGNGPMVLILPEQTWYWRVKYAEVSLIIEQHLYQNNPVKSILYPKFHRQ